MDTNCSTLRRALYQPELESNSSRVKCVLRNNLDAFAQYAFLGKFCITSSNAGRLSQSSTKSQPASRLYRRFGIILDASGAHHREIIVNDHTIKAHILAQKLLNLRKPAGKRSIGIDHMSWHDNLTGFQKQSDERRLNGVGNLIPAPYICRTSV